MSGFASLDESIHTDECHQRTHSQTSQILQSQLVLLKVDEMAEPANVLPDRINRPCLLQTCSGIPQDQTGSSVSLRPSHRIIDLLPVLDVKDGVCVGSLQYCGCTESANDDWRRG